MSKRMKRIGERHPVTCYRAFRSRIAMAAILACAWVIGAAAAQPDLTELSLEELMNIEVTTASRKLEGLSETAAPVYVITGEELLRSGARTLPDALRTVPGIFVGSVDANKWAVSSRGFSGLFANKLLVLIDGRSVYNPMFSGVFWEAQDVEFHDVARIEVIRGPGASLWGANAVNGVINIITKPASQTQGAMVQVGLGTEEHGAGSFRYGGALSPEATWRIYGKVFTRDASEGLDVSDRADDWQAARTGARLDWSTSGSHLVTLSGEAYHGHVGQFVTATTSLLPPYQERLRYDADISGGHVLARWSHRHASGLHQSLQAYYDRARRAEVVMEGTLEHLDMDYQQRYGAGHHDIVWGVGYRLTRDRYAGSFTMSMDPDRRDVHLLSGFVQYEIRPIPDQVRLTVGTKLERNTYTGTELQPGVRVWWRPHDRHTVWGALARAARTPSRAEHDFRAITSVIQPDSLFTGSPVALVQLMGDDGFDSERLRALDVGYRAWLGDNVAVGLAGFRNTYDDVRTNEPPDLAGIQVNQNPRHLVLPVRVDNLASARSWGVEATVELQSSRRWRVRGAYSLLRFTFSTLEQSADLAALSYGEEEAEHMASLRSSLNLGKDVALDLTARYVGELHGQALPSYLTLDARVGWRPRPKLELSVSARNLLDSPRVEYLSAASSTLPSRVQPAVFAALTWGR